MAVDERTVRTVYERELERAQGIWPDLARARLKVTRGTRTMGSYRCYGPEDHRIGISRLLADPDAVVDTVRHELAHQIVAQRHGGRTGHGPVWKRYAREIGCARAACGARVDGEAVTSARPFVLRCSECGHVFTWVSPSKAWRRPRDHGCRTCGPGTLRRFYRYPSGELRPVGEEPLPKKAAARLKRKVAAAKAASARRPEKDG